MVTPRAPANDVTADHPVVTGARVDLVAGHSR
jgi:hypothetical protein